ncbi:polysaccharide pyruvyl transferase family protein [Patescibacteria group bacterium]|nr:polysaccharide pyruvyl transferase family protein [Patescibacteria group bacterium]
MEEVDLNKFLGKYRDTKVDFYRFPGNYGDSLIWHGTKILLNELNIRENYVEINSSKINNVLFIDGGGNFVDYYSNVRDFLNKKHDLYKEIVILPHTIFGDKQINTLNNLSGDITVFCRERVTFDFVKQNFLKGNVYLWHDCAFYNDFPKSQDGKGVLNAFRKDKESILDRIPNTNNDLSYNGYATKPLEEIINSLNQYEEINTDRLHVAICAALLGKKVNLFPNSYYKNKAVFDYSLRNFPNISFRRSVDK